MRPSNSGTRSGLTTTEDRSSRRPAGGRVRGANEAASTPERVNDRRRSPWRQGSMSGSLDAAPSVDDLATYQDADVGDVPSGSINFDPAPAPQDSCFTFGLDSQETVVQLGLNGPTGVLQGTGEQASAARMLVDQNGEPVPGSQDSELATIAGGLQISGPDEQSGRHELAGEVQQHSNRHADLPPVPERFIRSGGFSCPWCDWSTRHMAGLMTHCTRQHPLEILSEETAQFMTSLGRGMCRDCGFLRRGRQCGRCTSTRAFRTIRAGDCVQPVNLEALNNDSDAEQTMPSAVARPSKIEVPSTAGQNVRARSNWLRGGQARQREGYEAVTRQHRGTTPWLTANFLQRLRSMTGSSTVRIPKCLRERLAAAASDCLEDMLDDDGTWAALAEAHAKLLLYSIPRMASAVAGLEQRLALWEDQGFEGLLLRIQRQAQDRDRALQQTHADSKAAPQRARRLAREAARSKAVLGLQGGVKKLTPDERACPSNGATNATAAAVAPSEQ